MDRFVAALKDLQDELGEYQDAATARAAWARRAATVPAAWFGAGWLAAREAALASECERECRRAERNLRSYWKD